MSSFLLYIFKYQIYVPLLSEVANSNVRGVNLN
jgi:hypothetical protein